MPLVLVVRREELVLAELPSRHAAATGGGGNSWRNIAGAEVADAAFVTAEPYPGIKLAVVVGLAFERHDPFALARPAEALALGVQAEAAFPSGDEERPAVRVRRVGHDASRL